MPDKNPGDKPEDKPEESPPAFNAGIATLQRIDGVLNDIRKNTLLTGIKFDIGRGQGHKYRLIKDLFLIASPLLTSKQVTGIRKKINNLELKNKEALDCGNTIHVPAFSNDVEKELDNIMIDIQLHLQEKGYIMPSKSEKGLF